MNIYIYIYIYIFQEPSVRLLKHIIRCYLRLSENPK